FADGGALGSRARDQRHGPCCRRGLRDSRRGRAGTGAARAHRHRAAGVPPAADDDRAGERRHPARTGRPARCLGAGGGRARGGRPRAPADALPGAAVRRRAAARRHCPRDRAASGAHLRRRADRQPRREDRPRHHRAALRPPRRDRRDAGDDHPRRGARRALRPRGDAGRRADRERQRGMTRVSWPAAWRIARRDLHRRFRGLGLLLVCLFLGVGALAAIGSLTSAIRGELDAQGRTILGGDLEIEVWQRLLNEEESAFLAQYGALSPGYRMQAMAVAGGATTPIELKAVATNWPLYGELTLADGRAAGAPADGEAWLAEGAAERLGVEPGESIRIGTRDIAVGGIIVDEPDRLSEGFALGQTVI